jgi:hypothetical protein
MVERKRRYETTYKFTLYFAIAFRNVDNAFVEEKIGFVTSSVVDISNKANPRVDILCTF